MKNRKTIFNYIGEALISFAVSILFLMIIGFIVGEDVKTYSSMFSLGNKGLTFTTILQFFAMSFIMTLLNFIFFSDSIFKSRGFLFRIIGMCTGATIVVALFAVKFDWFPINEWKPWIGYATSFLIFFTISCVLMALKTKLENYKMEEALNRIKEGDKDES